MHKTLWAHFSQCLEQLDTVPVMYPNVFECNFVYSYMYAYIYSSSHHSGRPAKYNKGCSLYILKNNQK